MTLTATTTQKLDTLGAKLADAAMLILARTCRERLRALSDDALEAVCAAMRAASRKALDQMLDDAKAAPWLAHLAFESAALSIAQAGIAKVKEFESASA